MIRSHTAWLLPVALTLVGFGTGAEGAIAQNTYPFSANYETVNTTRAITPDVLEVSVSGDSTNAPYGLTEISGLVYARANLATGFFGFSTDPTAFGLQGEPLGSITLFGSGSDKLFGTDIATGSIDLGTLTATASGTFTATGGEGRFSGATGTLALSDVYTLSPDPTVPLIGRSLVNGSIQTVPEPRTDTMPVVMGVIGAGVLLRQRRRRSTGSVAKNV